MNKQQHRQRTQQPEQAQARQQQRRPELQRAAGSATEWNNRGVAHVRSGTQRMALLCFRHALTISTHELRSIHGSQGTSSPPAATNGQPQARSRPQQHPQPTPHMQAMGDDNGGDATDDQPHCSSPTSTQYDDHPATIDEAILRWSEGHRSTFLPPSQQQQQQVGQQASPAGQPAAFTSLNDHKHLVTPEASSTMSSSQVLSSSSPSASSPSQGRDDAFPTFDNPIEIIECENISVRGTLNLAAIIFNIACVYHNQGVAVCKSAMVHKADKMYEKAMELLLRYCVGRQPQDAPLLDLLIIMIWSNRIRLQITFGQNAEAQALLSEFYFFLTSMGSSSPSTRLVSPTTARSTSAIIEQQRSIALVSVLLIRLPLLAAAA